MCLKGQTTPLSAYLSIYFVVQLVRHQTDVYNFYDIVLSTHTNYNGSIPVSSEKYPPS